MRKEKIALYIMAWIILLSACEKLKSPENHAPFASFIASVTSGNRPLEVEFDASLSTDEDDDDLTYNWNFGDGVTGTGVTCTHTFLESGYYTVTLTVADMKGLDDQASISITVDEPPDLFPISNKAQWVYHIRVTGTENGIITEQEEGTLYLVVTDLQEKDDIDYMTLRVTGKNRYLQTTSMGDYIYLTHDPANGLMVSRSKDEAPKTLISLKETSWKGYCMFFSGPSSNTINLSTSTVQLDLGNFETFKVQWHMDNWNQSYVTERMDLTYEEYIDPEIGLIYRRTSRYVDFLDCWYCPVYGGSSEVVLTGYYITLANGSVVEGGSGYNIDNPYGGTQGLKTIYTELDVESISVYLDGEYAGTIEGSSPSGIICDQEGALNIFRPAGICHITAEASNGYLWGGDITFNAGICGTVEFTSVYWPASRRWMNTIVEH